MNEKNIKKQPSAQALSNDDLESVGGGWSVKGRKMVATAFNFNPGEIKSLEARGYTVTENPAFDGKNYFTYGYLVRDPEGNMIKNPNDIEKILGKPD